jgi:type IV secretion system protein VirB10
LVLPIGTQIPLILQNTINTRNAQKGDRVYFETLYPIIHEGKVVIPVGSYVRGTLTQAKRPGRIKGRAQIHVRFDDMTLPNGYTVDLNASLANAGTTGNQEVDRAEGGVKSGGSKGEDVTTVVKTTGTGTVLGGLSTGTRTGAGTGSLIGAGVGLATVLFTRGKELILPRGTSVDITLDRPLPLDPALAKFDWTDYSTPRRDR